MDETDNKILAILRENSRTSNIEISKRVGLTEGAVRSRIKKLTEDGIIKKFTIKIAEQSAINAVVLLKAKKETKKMMEDVSALGIHQDAYEISGEFDGCIILFASSMEKLDEKIDRIRNLPSVSNTQTFISFRHY
ncbi:Lrp/AsnC family transcriptional regulator [Candidatus Micrarchaeota archaeon]|nr:Lrp/AsnC family transcriptional regulator [Candidatus Micrarchaeota archaeon]